MLPMLKSFLKFYFSPTLRNWRDLRRECMKKLPPVVKAERAAQ